MDALARAATEEAVGQLDRALKDLLSNQNTGSPDLVKSAFTLLERYELLSVPLYRLRVSRTAGDPFRERIEDAVGALAHDILALRRQRHSDTRAYTEWLSRYRKIWRDHFGLFVQTWFLFLVSIFAGWLLATSWPDYSLLVIPQHMIEDVLNKTSWFSSIQKSPLMDGVMIASNNIRVAMRCFALGAVFGIGGMYILVFNGLMVGALFGFCATHGFEHQLGEFVVGHGFLELSIIVASAFGGFLVGRVFYQRPFSLFGQRMAKAGREAGVVLAGILPWLLLAATIEVGFSPWPFYSLAVRLGVGLTAGLLFWTWTFA